MIKHTLAALAIALAQPAQADTAQDLFKGVVAVIILNEVLKDRNTHTNTHSTVIYTGDHRVCSTEIERLRNGQTLVHELDCRGNIISSRWR